MKKKYSIQSCFSNLLTACKQTENDRMKNTTNNQLHTAKFSEKPTWPTLRIASALNYCNFKKAKKIKTGQQKNNIKFIKKENSLETHRFENQLLC